MKNFLTRLFFAGVLFLFCNATVFAQDSTDVDSAETTEEVTPPKSLGDTTPSNSPEGGEKTLRKHEFETDDSMQVYKKDKEFAYMKYLDSLLRKTKDLTVDTFSVGASSSGTERPRNQRVYRAPINIFSNPVVKIILWVLAVLLIGFLIWKLFLGENFFKRNKAYKRVYDTQKEEDELSDASAYDKLIAEAVRNKNYRLAIRYLYLQTLKKLADSGLLQFSADKTNYQYVRELNGKPYQNDFAAITLNYEYVWYGKFEIGEDIYARLSNNFKSFNQKV